MKRFIFLIWLFLPVLTFGQNVMVENGPLYSALDIPKIYVTIDPDSLDALYLEENWYEDHEYPAQMVFETASGSVSLDLIGLRFRGNTSRDKVKKSFKLSLNAYVPGQKIQGVEKLNLNAEVNDPAMMRSRLTWDLFKGKNIPSPRSNHVELYINGDYYGLYLNTEHIDDEFVNTWFGNKSGNLYKCTYPADLNFISNNPDDYKVVPWNNRTYDLKTNVEIDDYSDLSEFIGFLNQSTDAEFACKFSQYFNVYNYLKIAAIDVLTGNWDGYIYNQNNFYLYHNPLTGKFEYIPYDLDNTWGIDWLDRDWSNRNLYQWSQGSNNRPLYDRLMDVPDFRNIFSWHIHDLLDNRYYTTEHQVAIENLQDFIAASALADTYRPIDYGWSADHFFNSLTEAAGGHVDFGIFPFANARKNSALSQVENVAIAPVIWDVKENFSNFPEVLEIRVIVDGPVSQSATINWWVDGISQSSLLVNGVQSTYNFEANLPSNAGSLEYNVTVTGANGLSRNAFCESRTIQLNQNTPTVVINEVMSSNSSTIADEHGDFDDWIELYNYGTAPVNLSGFHLSDNNSAPLKWALPAVDIQPGEFMLIWADSDMAQGPFHTNFNISASDETIYLFRQNGDVLQHIDQIALPPLPTDYTFGRAQDASLPWILFWFPTPGAPNQGPVNTADQSQIYLTPYPNPSNGMVQLGRIVQYRVHDLTGRLLFENKADHIDLSAFANGYYMLSAEGRSYKIVKGD